MDQPIPKSVVITVEVQVPTPIQILISSLRSPLGSFILDTPLGTTLPLERNFMASIVTPTLAKGQREYTMTAGYMNVLGI